MKYLRTCIALLLIGMPMRLLAQEDWENGGEIRDVEVEIVKDREIELPAANRNFRKIPPMPANGEREPVNYFYNNINFDLPDLKVSMRPLRIRDEKLSKLYGNYIKGGFGNYVTPYAEAYFNSKRSKSYSYGAHFNYLNSKKGPVDGDNSGSGKVDLDFFGKYFTPKAVLSGDIGFDQRSFHFYGYPENVDVDRDTLKQNFNNYYLRGSIESADVESGFQYFLGLRLDYLNDNRDASEAGGKVSLRTRYDLSEQAFMQFNGDVALITRQDELIESTTRNLFRLHPSFGFQYERFKIQAGFNAVYENDTLGDADRMHFYPTVKASYPFSEQLTLYAGIGGDIQKNTLKTLSEKNPFIDDNIDIYHTNKTFDLFGGIKGKLNSRLSYGAGFSAANYKNMYYFMNAPDDQSKFIVIYDTGNTAVLNLFGELSFNDVEDFRFSVRGDYWGYSTNNVDEAWHKPNYEVSSLAVYNLFDKVRLSAEAYTMGGIKALDVTTDETISLDPFFDLNLMIDYLVSDQFSIFFQFNNILAQEYETFYHYPSRGLQFMGGLTYSF